MKFWDSVKLKQTRLQKIITQDNYEPDRTKDYFWRIRF